jgi:hypothetical protein
MPVSLRDEFTPGISWGFLIMRHIKIYKNQLLVVTLPNIKLLLQAPKIATKISKNPVRQVQGDL